jgi:hypothetical protein
LPDQFLSAKPWEMLFSVILEQCYVIKFLVKEQNGPKEIQHKPKAITGD